MKTLKVPDMSCGHCKAAIEKAISGADPSARIDFDMDDRKVAVSTALSDADLTALLEKEGYPSVVQP